MKLTSEYYSGLAKRMKELSKQGFNACDDGFVYFKSYSDNEVVIDLTATDPALYINVICNVIYEAGKKAGKKEITDKFKDLLEITE